MDEISKLIMLFGVIGANVCMISIVIMAIIDNKRNECYQQLRELQRKNNDKS